MLMAMFEQPTLKDTIQVLTEVQPLLAADGQIYAEKFTSACLICKVFYGKMKAQ